MFSRRTPLAIVLTVVVLLAMLAPAALAAPEYVHGLAIDSPTTADPAYIYPKAGTDFDVDYTITIVGTQVDNIWVRAYLFNKYSQVIADEWNMHVPGDVNGGLIKGSLTLYVDEKGSPPDGWYDLHVCAGDEWSDKWCDFQANAVLIQRTFPVVDLEKPEWEAAVTGTSYLMVGSVMDPFGITKVEFEYCDISNSPHSCTKWHTNVGDQDVWVKIANGALTNPQPTHLGPHWVQWEGTWDSTQVPDEWPWDFHGDVPAGQWPGGDKSGAFIRMCAYNLVGLSNCYDDDLRLTWDGQFSWPDAHKVYVNNHYWVDLEPGWNLISTPLMPYDNRIEAVLMHLIANKSVKQVVTRVWNGSAWVWETWTPAVKGPKSLTEFNDGQGYWINMTTEDVLTINGTWTSLGPQAPPEYAVFDGWNMIGYTQWGRPMWKESKFAMEYLGPGVHPYVQALWRYDAGAYRWRQVIFDDDMVKGAGYWLATIQDGRINP